jgi:calmodulin
MLDEIREIFDHFDKDGNGTIEAVEFAALLQALGADMEDAEVAIGLEALDTDGNGRIDFDEFVSWWADR